MCVAVTHGHIDHVGSLPSILKAYPDVQVVMHEAEAPFLTGVGLQAGQLVHAYMAVPRGF